MASLFFLSCGEINRMYYMPSLSLKALTSLTSTGRNLI